jgi:DHA1 family tetracycline resistance protein-like MFS transporter
MTIIYTRDLLLKKGNTLVNTDAQHASGEITSSAPNFTFILVCVFIDSLALGLAFPSLPGLVGAFVHSRDEQSYWYGLLVTTFSLTQFFCLPVLGAISDKVGRRPVLLYSMLGMCVNFLTSASAPSLLVLFLGRVIGGASAANISTVFAYAADVSTRESRVKSFGKVGAAFGLGFICGPLLGGLAGNINLRLPFLGAAVLCALNFIYGYLFVPESLTGAKRAPLSLSKANPFKALAGLAQRADIRPLIRGFALITFAQGILLSTWVLYTTFRFQWSPRQNGAAFFCVGLASTFMQARLLGWLIKRVGEARLLFLALASGATAYLSYALATHGWVMYATILCNLLGYGATSTLQGIVSKATEANRQGALMGSLQSLSSVIFIVAPAVGTAILARASHFSPGDWRVGAPFFVCALLQTGALLCVALYFRTRPRVGQLEQQVVTAPPGRAV